MLLFRKHHSYNMDLGSSYKWLPLAAFAAWMWSFPMYGPLLHSLSIKKDINTGNLFLAYLLGMTCMLTLIALWSRTRQEDALHDSTVKIAHILSVSALALITMLAPSLPAAVMDLVMFICGVAAAVVVINIIFTLGSQTYSKQRSRNVGLALLAASLAYLPLLLPGVVSKLGWMANLIAAILPLCSITVARTVAVDSEQDTDNSERFTFTKFYWVSFVLLLTAIYGGGGIMYNIVYVNWVNLSSYVEALTIACYGFAALIFGISSDMKGRRHLPALALSVLGLAFLLLLPIADPIPVVVPYFLFQIGFAAADLFVLSTCADWASAKRGHYLVSVVQLVNILGVTLAVLGLRFWSHLITETIANYIGVLLMLLALPLLNFMFDTSRLENEAEKEARIEHKTKLVSFLEQKELTDREIDVAMLVLEGMTQKEMADSLTVSVNTIKTHLRHIYSKTETSGQKDFILFVWKYTAQSETAPTAEESH